MRKNDPDVLEILQFIKERMLTKDDVREIVHDEIQNLVPNIVAVALGPVHRQLQDIERRLDALEHAVADIRGFAKEIDQLRAEILPIKKHLGLITEIAA